MIDLSNKRQRYPSGGDLGSIGCMGRPARPNIPGATYHVMNRGNRKGFIFEDDEDRRQFLRKLIEKQDVHKVKIAAGTLMRGIGARF